MAPLGYLGKNKIAMQQLWERGVRKYRRNNPASTKVSEEGGAPGSRAEISLQPMEKTVDDAGCLPAAHRRQQCSWYPHCSLWRTLHCSRHIRPKENAAHGDNPTQKWETNLKTFQNRDILLDHETKLKQAGWKIGW